MRRNRYVTTVFSAISALVLALGACGAGDDDPTGLNDPAIEPFVGTWVADAFTVTRQSDGTVVDILANGSFTINVQASGTYTATLQYLGQPFVEIGEITISGSSMIQTPTVPAGFEPSTVQFQFNGADRLILDGPTELVFDLESGEVEPGTGHIELERRSTG